MKRLLIVLGAVLALAATLDAEPGGLSVAYVEGDAQVALSGSWTSVAIGDIVPAQGRIRLGEGTCVELAMSDGKLVLDRPGTYAIPRLLAVRGVRERAGAGKIVSQIIVSASGRAVPRQSAAMGVRSVPIPGLEELGVTETRAQTLLAAGKDAIQAGRYGEAKEKLTQALAAASEQEASETRFFLAQAQFLAGDVRAALATTADLAPAEGDPRRSDCVLFKAELLIETSAYVDAIEWLSRYEPVLSADERNAPAYWFLLALACQGTGDAAREKQALDTVLTMAPDSPMADAAQALAAGL